MSDLLGSVLEAEGHSVSVATDRTSALDLISQGNVRPDILLADYNLPNGMNGLQLTTMLRARSQHISVIILTGDISIGTFRDIAAQNYVQLNKPVSVAELKDAIQRLLTVAIQGRVSEVSEPTSTEGPVVFIVDDDAHVRNAIRKILEDDGRSVQVYESAEAFLACCHPRATGCLLIDAYLPGISGVELLQRLADAGHQLPAIMITGSSDIQTAVQAMKSGAKDFIEKPAGRDELLKAVSQALEHAKSTQKVADKQASAVRRLEKLTQRERQILDRIIAGDPNKNIAADLGISQRTVENHRAAIMKKTGSKTLPALVRLVFAISPGEPD